MKVKLFTHTDLDGVGCAVIAKSAFDNVDVEYCDYNEINLKVMNFIVNGDVESYDRIFITDISVDESTAKFINEDSVVRYKTHLIDHHGTALWLAEKYPEWAHVRVEESNLFRHLEPTEGSSREKVKSSGTTLFYKFLRNKHLPNIERNEKLKSFAEVVRRYDTWEWHNVYKNDHPKRLNDLLYLIGREKFLERFMSSPLPTFTDTESLILELEEHKINKYIWNKKRDVEYDVLIVNQKPYRFAYVFAEQYTSLLGNAIAEEHGDDIDFVVILDIANNKVSLRGIHDDIDLGKEIAKNFGGGGHPKASGFEVNPIYRKMLMKHILGLNYQDKEI